MKIKFKASKIQNIELLLARFRKAAKINLEGKLEVNFFENLPVEWALLSFIDFPPSLSTETKKQLLWNSLKILKSEDNFKKSFLLDLLNDGLREYYNRRNNVYFFLTTLSISSLPFRKIKLGSSTIFIHGNNFPKNFTQHRNRLLKNHQLEPDVREHLKVSVKIESKDYKEAFKRADYEIQVFRAFLCLLLNFKIEKKFNEKKREPINKIRLGEIATLHFTEGKIVDQNYYQIIQDFSQGKILEIDDNGNEEIKTHLKWAISKFNRCKTGHQKIISNALYNYVEAFDEPNKNLSFLKAWTVLEILSNSDQNDDLIKRCTAGFDNNEERLFQKQILEGLRLYRNEYVHEGDIGATPDGLTEAYFVQDFIKTLIFKFHLPYAGFFNNIVEATQYLDFYTSDLKELEMKKKVLDKVIHTKKSKI